MDLLRSIEDRFSFKAFGLGLLGVAAVYGGLFGYTALRSSVTMEDLESRLATQTVLVDRFGQSEDVIETQDHLETQDLVEAPPSAEGEHESDETAQDEVHDDAQDLAAAVGTKTKALREAPVDGFFEEHEHGRLPIAVSKDRTPFSIYKKPFVLNMDKPFIAVAVEQFGLSSALSEEMIGALPSSVSFILSPYSQSPEEWTRHARTDGHEVWLHLPMENEFFPLQDPGAKGLLTRVSLQYNRDRMHWLLGRSVGYAGVAAYTDMTLNNAGTMFTNMARNLFSRGLGFLELNTRSESFFERIAQEARIPHTETHSYLDIIDPQRPEFKATLAQIDSQGGTLVVVRPSPRNIPALKRWLESLQRRGIEIVPVSAVAALNKE